MVSIMIIFGKAQLKFETDTPPKVRNIIYDFFFM